MTIRILTMYATNWACKWCSIEYWAFLSLVSFPYISWWIKNEENENGIKTR